MIFDKDMNISSIYFPLPKRFFIQYFVVFLWFNNLHELFMRFSSLFVITLLFFVAFYQYVLCQTLGAEPPRLVIGIMVDGLQQKHLDLLWGYFDPAGFKRITAEGVRIPHVRYNIVSAGSTSDIATVMTGSVPFYHGVAGDIIYNRSVDKIRNSLYDDQQIGIGTPLMLSSYNLLSSTIVDELSMAFPYKSKSYAVAIGANEAIMLGGHAANGVVWIDDLTHKWVTTAYYKNGLCKSADDMNVLGDFKNISTRVWRPMYAINTYLSSAKESKKSDFEINPLDLKSKNHKATILNNTPSANSLVANLGLRIVTDEQMGMDNTPDALMLQFTVRTPQEKFFSLQSVEKEDMYLRLDRDIQNLLQKIDAKVGLDKTLVFLFANQTDVHSPTELGENNIPAGYFSANRSIALLNTYLMAIYGQEPWVMGYYGKNIFLNKSKIDEKKVSYDAIQKSVIDFMPQFEGVQAAYASLDVLAMGGDSNTEMARLRNSSHKNSLGDVVITLKPGWLELDDDFRPVGESNAIVSTTPLYFYGMKLKPRTVNESYLVIDIATTLARFMAIPAPNANIGKPIKELFESN
ncbi:MAG: hypothetical protein AUK44_07490 [Porphyromonadaceae bacterium CG2_30_38_12]|nr:MAG: hypothetical protein AUK44_07490 [Porphyromonadaceae bacterium CG2_30_38_12]